MKLEIFNIEEHCTSEYPVPVVELSSWLIKEKGDTVETALEFGRRLRSSKIFIGTNGVPNVKKVIFNNPCTIVVWADGTKTIVRSQDGDNFDLEKGLAMAIAKKALGNSGNYYDEFKKWLQSGGE